MSPLLFWIPISCYHASSVKMFYIFVSNLHPLEIKTVDICSKMPSLFAPLTVWMRPQASCYKSLVFFQHLRRLAFAPNLKNTVLILLGWPPENTKRQIDFNRFLIMKWVHVLLYMAHNLFCFLLITSGWQGWQFSEIGRAEKRSNACWKFHKLYVPRLFISAYMVKKCFRLEKNWISWM